ncbi:MAG TPA: acyltransferase [Granulicella sp.]
MKPAPAKSPFKREIELDFIRGIAILLVVDFHASRPMLLAPFTALGWKHFGWTGVDIFFILSGFLVGGLLVKEWKLRGRIDSGQFLIRRSFKIWPQYYFYLVVMLLTGHRSWHDLWGNFLNIQNYTGGIAHTWSLAVEEHAYLLLVAILAIAARRHIRMRSVFLFLAALSVCVAVLSLVLAAHHHDVFPTTHTRIDGIFCGVLLAMLYHYVPDTFHRLQRYIWLWLAIIVATLLYLRFEPQSPIAYAFSLNLADLSGVALLMLLYRHREGARHSFLYRLVAWIGLYSYGIYLWHVSVVSYGVSLARHLHLREDSLWLWMGIRLAGILLGVFFSKMIEFPMLKLRDRLFPRRVDSAVGTPAEIEAEEAPLAAQTSQPI